VDKPNKVTFVDYTWDKLANGDILFDKELTLESMSMYEGKTFKVKIHEGRILLKFVEDWDMMPDPDDIDWSKYEN
jgi:hypothetical protein